MAGIVLVHGFWADGSSWSGVIPRLLDAGHQCLAVQLPLASFSDDVATVVRAASRLDGPVVVAGHSYGGAVISEAANSIPGAAALVYVAAYGLDQGDDVNALNEQFPPAAGGAIQATADGHLWLDVEHYAEAFCADVDPALASVMARTQGPAALACLAGLTAPPAWKKLRSWYLIATADRMISPDAQRFMAKRMGATTAEVTSSHAALVAHPAATADLILQAAR